MLTIGKRWIRLVWINKKVKSITNVREFYSIVYQGKDRKFRVKFNGKIYVVDFIGYLSDNIAIYGCNTIGKYPGR